MAVVSTRSWCNVYVFGEFRLNVPERSLMREGCRIHLAPKTFDVLVALVERASCLFTKHALLEQVWPDTFVDEGILSVHVAQLRKVLCDTRAAPRYIETVSRSGYRFIAPVRCVGAEQADAGRWFDDPRMREADQRPVSR